MNADSLTKCEPLFFCSKKRILGFSLFLRPQKPRPSFVGHRRTRPPWAIWVSWKPGPGPSAVVLACNLLKFLKKTILCLRVVFSRLNFLTTPLVLYFHLNENIYIYELLSVSLKERTSLSCQVKDRPRSKVAFPRPLEGKSVICVPMNIFGKFRWSIFHKDLTIYRFWSRFWFKSAKIDPGLTSSKVVCTHYLPRFKENIFLFKSGSWFCKFESTLLFLQSRYTMFGALFLLKSWHSFTEVASLCIEIFFRFISFRFFLMCQHGALFFLLRFTFSV